MWLDSLVSHRANVGNGERVASAVAGLGLAVAGFTRRPLLGFTMVAVGAALVVRGARGVCPVYRAMGIDGHNMPNVDNEVLDSVEQASLDSFPASDAPARRSIT